MWRCSLTCSLCVGCVFMLWALLGSCLLGLRRCGLRLWSCDGDLGGISCCETCRGVVSLSVRFVLFCSYFLSQRDLWSCHGLLCRGLGWYGCAAESRFEDVFLCGVRGDIGGGYGRGACIVAVNVVFARGVVSWGAGLSGVVCVLVVVLRCERCLALVDQEWLTCVSMGLWLDSEPVSLGDVDECVLDCLGVDGVCKVGSFCIMESRTLWYWSSSCSARLVGFDTRVVWISGAVNGVPGRVISHVE
nr:hypothetical protein Iba_chr02eCG8480 [Ipomoea batatas]